MTALPFNQTSPVSDLLNPDNEPIEQRATLQHIRYQSDDETYMVANFLGEDGQTFTANGMIMGVVEGDHAILNGRWTETRYGIQFKVDFAEIDYPTTSEGVAQFLCTHIEGIGPKLSQRIVEEFGQETPRILNEEPDRLREVSGIGAKKFEKIKESWLFNQNKRKVMMVLQSHKISPAYASRIIREFAEDTLHVVQHEPYRLAREVNGIGFKIADRIAQDVGIDLESPQRVEAGVEHILYEAENSKGHCYLEARALLEQARTLLEVPELLVVEALTHLADLHRVQIESLEDGVTAIFRRFAWRTERSIADDIARLYKATEAVEDGAREEVQELTSHLERLMGLRLAEAQREAVELALTQPLLVVTGGPGTGKTTLVRVLVAACKDQNYPVFLAAPTGRAAKRLNEATGHEARTLHRLLEFSFIAGGFQRDQDQPLESGLYVIDEASMIDIYLMRSLLRALPNGSRLVLVGDIDQLPSVGPGAVLSDFIESTILPVVSLEQIFRQAAASLIVQNAHLINQGKMPRLPSRDEVETADYFAIDAREPEDVERTIVGLVHTRLPKKYGLDPMSDIQVLCPMRVRAAGAEAINKALQDALNPGGEPLTRSANAIRVGDRVMQLRNNYEKDVYNGDVGRVMEWNSGAKEAIVQFEDEREVKYAPDELGELSLAYACTVHKSQGSEYPAVIIPLVRHHYVMLQRNLIYTALTRARRLVVLVGDPRALRRAVENIQPSARNTRLAHRLLEVCGEVCAPL